MIMIMTSSATRPQSVRRYRTIRNGFSAILLFLCFAVQAASIPSPDKLLSDDTLVVVTIPDFAKLREFYRKSPQRKFWNDPAMKEVHDNFLSKWKEEFVQPLERELNVSLDSYASLPQGQVTFALTQNASSEDQPVAWLLLLDTRDKSAQLKTNIANLRKNWVEAGKIVKTEKIRDQEFAVLPMSSNDVPKTLKKFFPQPAEVQELPPEGETKKAPPRNEIFIGQVESLLIIGSSAKAVEKVLARLTGGAIPGLGDLAAYQANYQSFFRDVPFYGWVNVKSIIDITRRKASEQKGSDAPDPFGTPKSDKVLSALGLAGLKTVAFSLKAENEGSLFQVFFGVPEAGRQGLLKVIAGEAKESSPPQFVPADVVKFRRWRLDGQKAWAALEKMLAEISPQSVNTLNFILDTANTAAKDKDPSFDIRKNLIGNLGDDIITYAKAPRGNTGAQSQSPPSLILLGSPHPEQLTAALKSVLVFISQQAGAPAEREFLGRKIFSATLPAIPLPMSGSSRPAAPSTLNYAASGGYLALSTDASLLEEYLRSSESQAKTLRELPGLAEATQKVSEPGTGLLGYENRAETIRAAFEAWKKQPNSLTNSASNVLPGGLGMAGPEKSFKEWLDVSLLPPFNKVARYFHFMVYGMSANVEGLTLKFFAPVPPALKGSEGVVPPP
jgi:hypothetical protein